MTLISSRMTLFNKRVFPALWLGVLGYVVLKTLWEAVECQNPVQLASLIFPVIMGVVGYFVMKLFVFALMDEVWVAGDVIIIKKKNKEEQILLSDIMNVSYSVLSNPPRVTLSLRKPCAWGTEVTFAPPISINPLKKHPIIQDLITRVDARRG